MVIGELAVVLSAKTQQFVKDFGASEKAVVAFGQKTTAVGKNLTAGLTLPIVGLGAAGVAMAEDMNKGMANVATLIPGNRERLEELKDTVQDVQIATGKMTTELTEGMFQVISAFGEGADTQMQFELTAKAAVAGQTDLAGALALGSAVTKAYGDTTQEALGKVFDLAFKTNELGQTTFPELAAAIGRVTPLANELGLSQENLFAVMATLTGVTGNTAEVSTQFSSVLRSLMAPSEGLTKLFNDLGVSSGKAALQTFGFQGTLKLIKENADKTGVPLQQLLGRAEAMIATLALTDSQATKFVSNLKEMGAASGSVDKAFAEQTVGINEVGFSMSQVAAQATVLAQHVGDALAPAIMFLIDNAVKPLLDGIGWLIDGFNSMHPVFQGIAVTAGIVAAAIGPLAVAIGTLIQFLPIVKAGFAVLGTVMAGVSLPVLAVAAAIGVVVGGWIVFKDEIIQFGGTVIDGFLIPAFNRVIDAMNLWVNGFNSISSSLGGPVIDTIKRVEETGKTLGTQFIEDMHGMNDAAAEWLGLLDKSPETIEQVGGMHTSVISTATDEMVAFGQAAKQNISTGDASAGQAWEDLAGIKIPKFIDNMQIAGTMYRDAAGGMHDNTRELDHIMSRAFEGIMNSASMIPKIAIPEIIESMELASTSGVTVSKTLGEKFKDAFKQIKSGTFDLSSGFGQLASSVLSSIGKMLSKKGLGGVSGVLGSIMGAFTGGGGGFGAIAGMGGSAIGNMILPGIGGKLGGMLGGKIGKVFGGLFDDGGIVTQPTVGMFGKRGVPEAVIPLHRAHEFGFGGSGGGRIDVALELDGDVIAAKTVDLMEQRGMVS